MLSGLFLMVYTCKCLFVFLFYIVERFFFPLPCYNTDIGSRLHQRRHWPRDSDVIVLFVIGGFTPQEVQEIHAISEKSPVGSPRLLLGGTGMCKPSDVYDEVFSGLE